MDNIYEDLYLTQTYSHLYLSTILLDNIAYIQQYLDIFNCRKCFVTDVATSKINDNFTSTLMDMSSAFFRTTFGRAPIPNITKNY